MTLARLRSILLPSLLALAPAARAQTTGAIFGVVTDASTGLPVPGAEVTASGAALQGVQRAVTDERGGYRIPLLPPGPYRIDVAREGYLPASRADLVLRLGRTLRANLTLAPSAVVLPEATVRSRPPAVDVGTAESTTAVTRELYELLPVGRESFADAAVLSPFAQADSFGAGFGGAQSPENRVVVEGIDVGDPVFGTLALRLPAAFVEQLDVRAGGSLPEVGRASGAVLSAVTRSGSNELHGSVFSDFRTRRDGAPVGTLGLAPWERPVGSPRSFGLDLGGEVGGPVVRDRLWCHLGFAPRIERTVSERFLRANALSPTGSPVLDSEGNSLMLDVPGSTRLRQAVNWSHAYHAKLTWRADEDHSLSLASFGSLGRFDERPAALLSYRQGRVGFEDDVVDVAARWTGRFLQGQLVAEAVGGWHSDHFRPTSERFRDGVDLYFTPSITWLGEYDLGTFVPAPAECQDAGSCRVSNFETGGRPFFWARTDRFQARLAATWLGRFWGTHQVKGGADLEVTRSDRRAHGLDFFYTGRGARVGFGRVGGGRVLSPAPTGSADVALDEDSVEHERGLSPAAFLQDSWQPVPSLTLGGGVRWEGQVLENALRTGAATRIRILDQWAPRAQVAWDPFGQGRSKVSASWGRFYEAIPLAPAAFSFATSSLVGVRYAASSCPGFAGPGPAPVDPRSCTALVPGTVSVAPGVTPVAPGLKGQYVDQFGAGIEHTLGTDLIVALEYQGRRLRRAVEDMSSDGGFGYFIGNPGEGGPFSLQLPGFDAPAAGDPRGATAVDPITGRTSFLDFPAPRRDYDGLTLRVTKQWEGGWLLQASWTVSRLWGNYSGPGRPEAFQGSNPGALLPHVTFDYDLPELMANRSGLLPFDRTHLVKLFAARELALSPRTRLTVGAAYVGRSGTPVNALGGNSPRGTPYSRASVYLIPRGMAGRTPFEHQLDLRGQLEVALRGPYALRFRADLFNAVDVRRAIAVDEEYTSDAVSAIHGLRCSAVNAAASANPAAALQRACPDLAFLRTVDGRPVTVNPNYGRASSYQVPLSARLGVELAF